MLSRKDIRPQQTQTLLDKGLLPVSVDYRLCPEVTLLDGPMVDVCDALAWARNILPRMSLRRKDVQADGSRVVAVGWSTGGHLAMTLAWTPVPRGIRPPEAILAFYCPSDYEDPFWSQRNIPRGSEEAAAAMTTDNSFCGVEDILKGIFDRPITAYNVPKATASAPGGWMAPSDPRSRIALYMNWQGQTVNVLLNGLRKHHQTNGVSSAVNGNRSNSGIDKSEKVIAISPLAQIRRGKYKTPTFIIHGTLDDLIPWQQAERTYEALVENGIDAELRIVKDGVHLFDLFPKYAAKEDQREAVADGYKFLSRHAGLGCRVFDK